MTDLSSFMGMSWGDVEDSVLLDDGIYDLEITGYYDTEYVNKDGDPGFIITVTAKATDVIEGDFDPSSLGRSELVRLKFFGSEKALANKSPTISLKQFTRAALDMSNNEMSSLDPASSLELLSGRRFLGVVKRAMEGRNNDIEVANVVKFLEAL